MTRILPVAVVCALFAAAQGVYSPSDDVVTLTPSNFNQEVLQSNSLWLVEFYAPWCGHCRTLTPEWKKAATALKGIVKVGAVDCDQHKELGGQFQIRGFPTIKVFGANKNKPEDYQGGRTSDSIVDAAINALRSLVKDRLSGRGGGGGGSDYAKQYRERQQMQQQQQQQQQQGGYHQHSDPQGEQQQPRRKQKKQRNPSQQRGQEQGQRRQPNRRKCAFRQQEEDEE